MSLTIAKYIFKMGQPLKHVVCFNHVTLNYIYHKQAENKINKHNCIDQIILCLKRDSSLCIPKIEMERYNLF